MLANGVEVNNVDIDLSFPSLLSNVRFTRRFFIVDSISDANDEGLPNVIRVPDKIKFW